MATREEIDLVLRSGTEARRAGQFREAARLMNEAAAMCGPGQEISCACVLRELGELARNRQDPQTAQTYYEQAVTLLRTSDDRLKLAHTIRHLGDVHASRQQWAEAELCYAEALNLYRSHVSPGALDLANAVRAFALLRTRTGRHEEARALWAEAAGLYESEGIKAGVEECRRRASQPG